jgi:general secretion pathway protein C
MVSSILKKYIWVINLILLAGLSYVIAQIINDRIKEGVSPPLSEARASSNAFSGEEGVNGKLNRLPAHSSYNVILKRNIFGLRYTSLEPSGINPNNVPQTTLNLELLGTVLGSGEKPMAVIKNLDTGKVRGYTEGELIDIVTSEGVKLAKIESCIAIVERGEGPETIKCKKDIGSALAPQSASNRTLRGKGIPIQNRNTNALQSEGDSVRQVSEGVYEIDQKMLNDALSDPNQLLTQARAIPQEDGLRFFAVRPNSIFFKIGLRNGDVIHSINDVDLDNIENALTLFQELRQQSHFSINLTRGGEDLTYQYTVR